MNKLMDWDSMTGLRYAEQYGEVLWISVHIHEQTPQQTVDFGVRGKHGYQHIVINMERPPHTDECFICGHEWDTSIDSTFHHKVCKRHTPHIKVSNHLAHSVIVEAVADEYSILPMHIELEEDDDSGDSSFTLTLDDEPPLTFNLDDEPPLTFNLDDELTFTLEDD